MNSCVAPCVTSVDLVRFKLSLQAETVIDLKMHNGVIWRKKVYIAAWALGEDIAGQVRYSNCRKKGNCMIRYESEPEETGSDDWQDVGLRIRPMMFLLTSLPNTPIYAGEEMLMDFGSSHYAQMLD